MNKDQDQQGFALVLVLIFTMLLFVLVTELVETAKKARLTGENDALLARMRNHQSYVLSQVEDSLRDDLEGGAAQSAAQGGAGGTGGLPMPGSGGGQGGAGAGGEGETPSDSSQDAWFEPTSYSDNEITTYVWVEDENRKFNILTLVSPDEEFARESKDRFVRLIDVLREETDSDLSIADGERLARTITEWLQGNGRTEQLPRPQLKSDDEQDRRQVSLPLHLEELLLLPGIDEDLFYDRVLDQKLIPGLESVLTIYTALIVDAGDPAKQPKANPGTGGNQQAQQQAQPGQSGRTPQQPEAKPQQPQQPGQGGKKEPVPPVGVGVKININTASKAVLRSLLTESEMPDATIEAILRYRNEDAPEEEEPAAGGEGGAKPAAAAPQTYSKGDYSGEIDAGMPKKKKIFKTTADLEQIPEFQNLANAKAKESFLALTTTESDVFTIHMVSLFKRNEKTRSFVLRRSRSVEVRLDDGDKAVLHPLILLEDCRGMRLKPVDFPEDEAMLRLERTEMDAFSAEEREWNPFFLDFYKPRPEDG